MGKIINQGRSHGGARPGAGRPPGSRDRSTVELAARAAGLVARAPLEDVLLYDPVDVLVAVVHLEAELEAMEQDEAGHGGARPGAGRPAGSRDEGMVASQADAAAVMARVPIGELLQLGAADVLRLCMLLALRRGDLDMAAQHARRLVPAWKRVHVPMDESEAGTAVMLVNRLVQDLHDGPDRPAAVSVFSSGRGGRRVVAG